MLAELAIERRGNLNAYVSITIELSWLKVTVIAEGKRAKIDRCSAYPCENGYVATPKGRVW